MRRLFAATAITALTLFATACGSDEKKSDSTEAESETTSEDEESEDTTAAAPDTTVDSDDGADDTTADTAIEPDDTESEPDDTEADDDSDDNSDIPDLSEQCATFEERFSDDLDFDNLDEISDAIEDVKEITPDDIDDDLDVLADLYDDMAALIEESGGDSQSAFSDPEFLTELEKLNTAEVQEATETVDEFFKVACPELGES